MADLEVDLLPAASTITTADYFLVKQGGVAKHLTGQVMIAFLTALADGHGGISGIEKISVSELVDTYRITLADASTFDFTVTNGEKGDKGDNAYVWIKYASQEPTEGSHSMGDLPDSWMGVYAGPLDTAPEDWTQYKWFKIKGEKGETGDPATLVSGVVSYQVGSSAAKIPTGEWTTDIPETPQGSYLWSRMVQTFNTGDPVTVYSVSRIGIDGLGTLRTINNLEPDENGNIILTAASVGALSKTGDTLEGALDADGNTITGLPSPGADSDAVPYSLVKDLSQVAWTNSAYSSEFAAQTLTLSDEANQGRSKFARIHFYTSTEATAMIAPVLLPIPTAECTFQVSTASGKVRTVTVQRKNTQYVTVRFSTAYYTSGSTAVVSNGSLIPFEIDFVREVT